jgi:Predicted AAA-ATPase/PD-(D/E)XK nuclease superfamily
LAKKLLFFDKTKEFQINTYFSIEFHQNHDQLAHVFFKNTATSTYQNLCLSLEKGVDYQLVDFSIALYFTFSYLCCMKNLPISIQSFPKIRATNSIYVDKTRFIYQLINRGSCYFLSRPRRFGKSLLISTLKYLYLGQKNLFEGLWIEDKWDWSKTNPVIHISFDAVDYEGLGLENAIIKQIDRHAKKYDIQLTEKALKSKFQELIERLDEQYGKVVILIDEYDKPIIDYLESSTIAQAHKNRDVLRHFYSILKNADEYLELVFITGISKFSKVSIFSHLNNLQDITLSEDYATLVGYTQQELELYFSDYLEIIAAKLHLSQVDLLEHMRLWYNGYSWDGVSKVYNPFGTLNFLADKKFKNYWFATGSPNFLIHQMKKHNHFNVENSIVDSASLDKYDLENLALVPLLFQTGYLTVKSMNEMTGELVLDYPNKEVRQSMYSFLIEDIAPSIYRLHTGRTIQDLNQAFLSNDLLQVQKILSAMIADLPYQAFEKQTEGLYHGLVHLIFSYLGMFINSEIHSAQGRADSVVQTPTAVFIFEFKFNKSAQEALSQIKINKYADKYRADTKPITAIGVNFDAATRTIDGWLEEVL